MIARTLTELQDPQILIVDDCLLSTARDPNFGATLFDMERALELFVLSGDARRHEFPPQVGCDENVDEDKP
jgi:hypothetical protein